MPQTKSFIVQPNLVEEISNLFLQNSPSNLFYNKNVFFTQGLKGSHFLAFQLIGNLGGAASQNLLGLQTDVYIISDKHLFDLANGIKHEQLSQLEFGLNSKKPLINIELMIVSESAFLKFIEGRCLRLNDTPTLRLLNKYHA